MSVCRRFPQRYSDVRRPRASFAVIDAAKLCSYLLFPSHPSGKTKAAFFRSLGYLQSEWQVLARDLLQLVFQGEARLGARRIYGRKYKVRDILHGPNRRPASVVTV